MQLTERQRTVLDLMSIGVSKAEIARKIGVSRNAICQTAQQIESKGLAPWLSAAAVPDTQRVTSSTVQYKGDGTVLQEWKRLSPSVESLRSVVEGLCETVKGKAKAKPRKARKSDSENILFELDIYDAHVGMYAEERETNDADYDCDIAARRMVDAAEGLASRASRPHRCVVVFGGDMLHADNRSNKTEMSGNVLDVDGLYQRSVQYIIAASRDVIQIAAQVAEEVEVVVLRGNHSWHSEAWLAQVLAAYYSECGNITVNIEPSPRSHTVFGDNLIVWAHGDKIAAKAWGNIIPAEFATQWGATKYRYLRCGHVHHRKSIAPVVIDEQAGLLVEYVPALCATDGYHSGAGYVGNQKGAVACEYHRDHGMISRYFHAAV